MPLTLRRAFAQISRAVTGWRGLACVTSNYSTATWLSLAPHSIHDLPFEILALIFVAGADTDCMFPTTVSHVCRTWRAIAHRTPSLWCHITSDMSAEIRRLHFDRVKACPLHVQLAPLKPRPGAVGRQRLDVQNFMHMVVPTIRRWRSLKVLLTDYEPFLANAALSGLSVAGKQSQATLLRDLTLIYPANDDSKEFCLFSGYAPQLRHLVLNGLRLMWMPSLFRNLTFLDYTHHGFSLGEEAVYEMLVMLRVCPLLQELRLLFPAPKPTALARLLALPLDLKLPSRSRPVPLPHLLSMHLRVSTKDIPYEMTQLVARISTPKLVSLHLVDLGHRRRPFPNLHAFMLGYPRLPSLEIVYVDHGWHGDFRPRRKPARR
ncbi:unnamed protein product [Mycena citricolor]|uniref:F-box domain-containing protein n=1 Tax=Mycena citricolor TaxID=2018698 RepID=A0AAD2HYB2_9AGAR|nr:unnamed protein product [Mycena citricolor]